MSVEQQQYEGERPAYDEAPREEKRLEQYERARSQSPYRSRSTERAALSEPATVSGTTSLQQQSSGAADAQARHSDAPSHNTERNKVRQCVCGHCAHHARSLQQQRPNEQ